MASTRAGMGRGVVVSPLNLELLGSGGEGCEGSQNLRTATLSFCEVSHRGDSGGGGVGGGEVDDFAALEDDFRVRVKDNGDPVSHQSELPEVL
ncbi:hypothetical protein OJ252_3003 [Cryptosporidium canis]|uniref:Uncharacterized protein n=1 Tax=Cryptosporidium canis TaxID=195482 RepID=A0ABQ8P3M6_9CRYT|nr:hypothetical protein OJ252_3003 [Cryptosporidium canis]